MEPPPCGATHPGLDLLKNEIESLTGRVRRLLRPRPIEEIAPHSTIDMNEVGDTEVLIEFVKTCRANANELCGQRTDLADVVGPAALSRHHDAEPGRESPQCRQIGSCLQRSQSTRGSLLCQGVRSGICLAAGKSGEVAVASRAARSWRRKLIRAGAVARNSRFKASYESVMGISGQTALEINATLVSFRSEIRLRGRRDERTNFGFGTY